MFQPEKHDWENDIEANMLRAYPYFQRYKAIDSPCTVCRKAATGKCSGCNYTDYCSDDCQEIDSHQHSLLCEEFATLPPRPTRNHKLSILFPADSPSLKLAWLFVSPGSYPTVTQQLGLPPQEVPKYIEFKQPHLPQYISRGHRGVTLFCRKDCSSDGSKPNQTILALTEWNASHIWKGNVVVSIYTRNFGEVFDKYCDIDTLDMQNVVDFLTDFGRLPVSQATTSGFKSWLRSKVLRDGSESLGSTENLLPPINVLVLNHNNTSIRSSRSVLGVIIQAGVIAAQSPNASNSFSKFTQRVVDPSHSIWKEIPTESTRMMGLPLLMFRLPTESKSNPSIINPYRNEAAIALNLRLLPSQEENWGLPTILWKDCRVGNVLVVRADGQDLGSEQVCALVGFMQEIVEHELATLKDKNNGELWVKTKEEFVQKWINWKVFEEYLEVLRVEKIVTEGGHWKEVKSPFGI